MIIVKKSKEVYLPGVFPIAGKLSAGKVRVRKPPAVSRAGMKVIRKCWHLNQFRFAKLMGVSVKTVQAWEQGTNKIPGPVFRLVEIFRKFPEIRNSYLDSKR